MSEDRPFDPIRHETEAVPDTAAVAVLLPPEEAWRPYRGRPAYAGAPFLAQLIATRLALPETRQRRRRGPAEGAAAYRSADDARSAPPAGLIVRASA